MRWGEMRQLQLSELTHICNKKANQFIHLPTVTLSLFFNLINLNIHHFSNSPSHCPQPPTHQQCVAMMPPVLLIGYVLKNVQSQTGDQRPLPRDTCATSYSWIQSRRKFQQLAWTCVHLKTQKIHVYTTHTHAQMDTQTRIHICLYVFERQGRRVSQSLPTDGYQASGKEQVWTANRQLLPKQRWDTKGSNLLPLCTVYDRIKKQY